MKKQLLSYIFAILFFANCFGGKKNWKNYEFIGNVERILTNSYVTYSAEVSLYLGLDIYLTGKLLCCRFTAENGGFTKTCTLSHYNNEQDKIEAHVLDESYFDLLESKFKNKK